MQKSKALAEISRNLPGFDLFWDAYPKKVAKPIAIRAWLSKVKDDWRWPEVLASLEIWKQCDQWQDPQFIPYLATFLNQLRWQDEAPKKGEKRKMSNESGSLSEGVHGDGARTWKPGF